MVVLTMLGVEGLLELILFDVCRGETEIERRAEAANGSVADQRQEPRSPDSSRKPLMCYKYIFLGIPGHVLYRLLITMIHFSFGWRGFMTVICLPIFLDFMIACILIRFFTYYYNVTF